MDDLKLQALGYFIEQSTTHQCPSNFFDRVLKRAVEAPRHGDIPGIKYRASSIGKPWIIQVLDRWYGGSRHYTVANCLNMGNGSIAQEILAELLDLGDYAFSQEQSVKFYDVGGHYDFVVTLKGDTLVVLECKSMASHNIASFANNPNDDFGYMSQLSLYWQCVMSDNPDKQVLAAFVLFDRSISKFRMVPITTQAMSRKIERIGSALKPLSEIEDYDVDALLNLVEVPAPVNGNVPGSMTWSRWKKVLYESTGEDRERYRIAPTESIARQLKMLPMERADKANPYDSEV